MYYLSEFFEDTKIIRRIVVALIFIVLSIGLTVITVYHMAAANDTLDAIDKPIIIQIGISVLISTILIANLAFLSCNEEIGKIKGFILSVFIFIGLKSFIASNIDYSYIFSDTRFYISEYLPITTEVALVSFLISLLIETVIFAIIAGICSITGTDIKDGILSDIFDDISFTLEGISGIFRKLSYILSILIVVITIIVFIVSLVVFIKNGNYSMIVASIKENGVLYNDKLITSEIFKIYFNTILKIVIGVLAILSYLIACFGFRTEDGLGFSIKILALALGLYYIIASILLWCITNIVGIIALTLIVFVLLKVIGPSIGAWLEASNERDREKLELYNLARSLKK